jgi:hypothetical protein
MSLLTARFWKALRRKSEVRLCVQCLHTDFQHYLRSGVCLEQTAQQNKFILQAEKTQHPQQGAFLANKIFVKVSDWKKSSTIASYKIFATAFQLCFRICH